MTEVEAIQSQVLLSIFDKLSLLLLNQILNFELFSVKVLIWLWTSSQNYFLYLVSFITELLN